jgi:predicted transcriptional regulator
MPANISKSYSVYVLTCVVQYFRMKLIHRFGKHRRTVPILMDQPVFEAMQNINQLKECYGEPSTEYLFSKKNSKFYVRGCDAMRKLSDNCPNLKHPKRLRSTMLRKHIATSVQIMAMTDNELEWLANHMGENKQTANDSHALFLSSYI